MPDKQLVITGRVVTMDKNSTVIPKGAVYINNDAIVAVGSAQDPPPAGFAGAPKLDTQGTIYPGLIELHNHLPYNVIPLWTPPKLYTNRDQWQGAPEYRAKVTGPISVLAKTPDLVPAIVRYVECRCLLGGVTTSQGIALASNQGITRFYHGLVRNVEQPPAGLHRAQTHIADVDAKQADGFLAQLRKDTCLLLHLSEGTDQAAREHFLALDVSGSTWAITKALAGIHCTALQAADFKAMADNGGAMVWSPLSNLLLYGHTSDVKAARDAKVRIGIGCDWAPSGSKNLLGEFKVAKAVSQTQNPAIFSDQDIVAMATRNAASILGWDEHIGSVEAGKLADLLVISGQDGDPYTKLVGADESAIALVMIGGNPTFGVPSLMTSPGQPEHWKLAGEDRVLDLQGTDALGKLSLQDAHDKLQTALQNIQQLAKDLEKPKPTAVEHLAGADPEWSIVLEHDEPAGIAVRPHLPFQGKLTGMAKPVLATAAKPLSTILTPMQLEPLTTVEDETFWTRVRGQANVPKAVKDLLPD